MEFLFNRLRDIAEESPPATPWRQSVLDLCRCNRPTSTRGRDLIEAARLLQAARRISSEAYAYIVTWVVEQWAEDQIGAIYAREFSGRLGEIERAQGLHGGWEFAEGQAPEVYRELSDEFDRRMRGAICECLRAEGEPVLAELHERDPVEYLRRRQAGRLQLLEG